MAYPFCSKRAKWAIDHLLKNGSICSKTILDAGHMHTSRVICDVRDQGIPVITEYTKQGQPPAKIKSKDGKLEKSKRFAVYRLGVPENINRAKFGGRKAIPKNIRNKLILKSGSVCNLSDRQLIEYELEVDHRIPFLLLGEPENRKCPSNYMLLSKSMQRKKSMACENCPNIHKYRKIENCLSCYWASPEQYTHIAMVEERCVALSWDETDVNLFEQIANKAKEQGISVQAYIKEQLTSLDI